MPERRSARASSQTALDEQLVNNADLEKILNDRQSAKGAAAEAAKKAKTLDDLAKVEIDKLELEVGAVVRVGAFRISKGEVAGREVAFETEPTERVTITRDSEV